MLKAYYKISFNGPTKQDTLRRSRMVLERFSVYSIYILQDI